MSNVLGELFQDQANAIREGLGDIGSLSPYQFSSKIREIVSLMGTGGSGDSGEDSGSTSGQSLEFAWGTVKGNGGRMTVEHGLGAMPDFVYVYPQTPALDANGYYVGNQILHSYGFKSDFAQANEAGTSSLALQTQNSLFGAFHYYDGIDTANAKDKGLIYCPDEETFEFGTTSAPAISGEDYCWLATTGMGGGGSSADVRYVTFMSEDGTEELYVKPVAVGDDCADPIARGLIETPTKESTAEFNYVNAGWATTPNGALDADALKSVTEDRTLYANFASVTRYYTITYLDDDGVTVLHTEQLTYGAVPSYEPTKGGAEFVGWTTTVVAVTGDATYTAEWIVNPLITDSWEEIIASVNDGSYATKYAVGQYKELSFGTEGTVRMQIAGFNMSAHPLADGSGNPAITWVAMELLNTVKEMNSNSGQAEGRSAYGGWAKSEMRTYLNSTVIALLPDVVKNNIKTVKHSRVGYQTNGTTAMYDSEDNLWLPESFSDAPELLPYSGANEKWIRCINGTETASTWWLAAVHTATEFIFVRTNGARHYGGFFNKIGVLPCFCT